MKARPLVKPSFERQAQYPVDPRTDFLSRCDLFLEEYRLGEDPRRFSQFIGLLHARFRSEITGIVRLVAGNHLEVVYGHPHPNPFIFRRTSFKSWLEKHGRKRSLASGIMALESSGKKYAPLWVRAASKRTCSIPDGTALLAAFNLPQIYPNLVDAKRCFLVLAYMDPFDVFDPNELDQQMNHVSSLIDTWGWRMMHYRFKLNEGSSTLAGIPSSVGERNRVIWNELDTATRHLAHLLNIPELVNLTRLHFASGRDDGNEIPAILGDFLGGRLENWSMEAPPNWPPRDGFIPPCKMAVALIYWSRWRDRTPEKAAQIGEYRKGPSASPPKELSDESKKRWARWHACYYRSAEEMVRLHRLAMDSVAEGGADLKLRSNSLGTYFFAQALDSPERNVYWQSRAPSNGEVLERFSNISCLANHLLAEFPVDSDTIQALIGTLSEFLHHKLGVPGRISLRQHLFQAARVEPTLHVLKKFYRDHFYHAIEVAFLGHFLLELRDKAGNPLWQRVARFMRRPGDKKRVFQQWYLAALLHDFGYIMDVQVGIRTMFKFFQHSPVLMQFGDGLDRAMEELSKSLGDEKFMGYKAEHQPSKDHGVIGAKHLQNLLGHIAQDDPSVVPSDYEPAIHAISRHNSRVHEVRFRDNPLSALLILCDTIQEWSRPRLDYNLAPFEMLSWLRNHATREHDLMGPLRQIELDGRYQISGNDRYFALKRAGALSIRLLFDEQIGRNHGIFQMWVDASANLQRLDLQGLGLKVDLEFETPLLATRNADCPFESQFYRLRDAARETHMDFLEKWFPNRRTDDKVGLTNGAVSYYHDGEAHGDGIGGKERLILHLNELSKEKRITKDVDEFHLHLRRWKRYADNLDYLGEYALPDYPI